MNLKSCKSNRAILPRYWVFELFRTASNIRDINIENYRSYTTNSIDIISQCSFKLPNKSKWRGHPFYYQCLDTIQKVNNKMPDTINEILSLPLWHNKFIKSYFDCDLSRKGFNCIASAQKLKLQLWARHYNCQLSLSTLLSTTTTTTLASCEVLRLPDEDTSKRA